MSVSLRIAASFTVLLGVPLAVSSASAQVFSLDLATAGAHGVFEDDLLVPSDPVPPPAVIVPGGGLILPPGPPPVDVDAVSFGHVFPGPYVVSSVAFSVAPGSVGAPATAVFGESSGVGFADEAADIFVSFLGGTNIQFLDGNSVPAPGGAPSMGLLEPGANTDAFDGGLPPGPLGSVHWTVTAAAAGGGHPAYPPGTSGADVWISPTIATYSMLPALYAPAAALGLALLDDIDGLAIIEDGIGGFGPGDAVYFSLTPGSPSLAGLGASPADILVTTLAGGPAIAFSASMIGLTALDDVDALDLVVVPEPSSGVLALLACGCLAITLRARRFRKPSGRCEK